MEKIERREVLFLAEVKWRLSIFDFLKEKGRVRTISFRCMSMYAVFPT